MSGATKWLGAALVFGFVPLLIGLSLKSYPLYFAHPPVMEQRQPIPESGAVPQLVERKETGYAGIITLIGGVNSILMTWIALWMKLRERKRS